MSKRNKITAALLTAAMMLSLLAGCGGGNKSSGGSGSAGDDLSQHVVLTMYCIGDEGGIHADEHIQMVNDYLTEKINAEIKPMMVSWGEYKQKLPMIWAGGEAYDLTFAANWTGYYTEGAKGAFMDITDLLPKYAPSVYASMEERGVIDSLKIDGGLYMVPTDVPEYTGFIINYREDLRQKYNCPEIVDDATFETYLKAIHDNEPGMQAFGTNGAEVVPFQNFLNEQDWSRPVENSAGYFAYDLKDPTHVFNVVDTPEYEAFVKKMCDYYKKGYISQSVMANTDATKDSFTAGRIGTYTGNFANSNQIYKDVKASNPEWEIGYYIPDMASGYVESTSPSNNGTAVGAFSKNPERALMFIELLNTDRDFYNLVVNGIEGVTYEWDPETNTKWSPEGVDANELTLRNLGMGLKFQKFELGASDDNPVLVELQYETFPKMALIPELAGFSVDESSIAAQLAGLKAVQDEFKATLEKGVVDPETGLATLRERMRTAGADEVMEEINRQIAEYLGN